MFKNKDLVRIFGLHDIPVNLASGTDRRVDFPNAVHRARRLADG